MDATQALAETNTIMTGIIANLTSDHREMPTPCTEWSVHDVFVHVCEGGHGIAAGLLGTPIGDHPDYLAEGPANGWAHAHETLAAVATPEVLGAMHQMPFGEVPGEAALSVIVADHLVHAWDVATATGQAIEISDELAAWAEQTWSMVVPPDRSGVGFDEPVTVTTDASARDRMIGFTGRTP